MVRIKNRYIAIEVFKRGKSFHRVSVDINALYISIKSKVQELYGDFGLASVQSGILAKYHNKETSIIFIRVRHGHHRLVTSSLSLIKEIANQPVMVHTLYTGATLKQCFLFVVDYQRTNLERTWSQASLSDKKIMELAARTKLH